MINEVFKLKLISARDCFLHFSFPVLQKISHGKSVSLLFDMLVDFIFNSLLLNIFFYTMKNKFKYS